MSAQSTFGTCKTAQIGAIGFNSITGNVGIGTTNPSTHLLDVYGSAGVRFRYTSGSNPGFTLYGNDGELINFYSHSGPTYRGNIAYTGGSLQFVQSSDIRLKENIQDLPGALNVVTQLRPRKYDLKAGEKDVYGFIAQEFYEVIPSMVTLPKDEESEDESKKYWSLGTANNAMNALIIKAIQEQQEQIEELKAANEELKQTIDALK